MLWSLAAWSLSYPWQVDNQICQLDHNFVCHPPCCWGDLINSMATPGTSSLGSARVSAYDITWARTHAGKTTVADAGMLAGEHQLSGLKCLLFTKALSHSSYLRERDFLSEGHRGQEMDSYESPPRSATAPLYPDPHQEPHLHPCKHCAKVPPSSLWCFSLGFNVHSWN